ncbi:uncharacterized protein C4orf54 homolog [Hippocampus zosterae]|uniref:uncharacterized protein C4orf54 homolog n=1 Tax=Hippocampus zosterae TaxID=109293 RepID=UPI00223DB5E2|nr:uncharacterized protein C4orf54 homolog [Hippocampus zosterae]
MKIERSHAVTPPPQPTTLREVTDLLQIVDSDGKSTELDHLNRELEDVGRQMSDLGIETDSDQCEEEEEDDDVTVLTEDESHYITTHAIRLSELSDGHDGDSDPGAGSSSSSTWDMEDGQQVFSFVDYASFDCNGVLMMKREGDVAISSLRESDPSSQFAACGEAGGQVHLSIKTTSRAINDPIQENVVYHAKDASDTSPSAVGGVDVNFEGLRNRAKGVIPAPDGKLQAKESAEYSSCASSELDDADKEVRNLTARTFKSLAYPYLDAINFGTSSESSTSECGINRWSTFVDLKYSNLSQSLVSQPTAERGESSTDFAEQLNGNGAPCSRSSTKKIEFMRKFGQGHSGVIRLTETLNFRCNVKSGMSAGEGRASVAPNPMGSGSRSTDEVTVNSMQGGRGRGATAKSKSMEGSHKKAIFASSVIQNVLSKKMQFEQERRMERGEMREPHHKGDSHRGKGMQRQSSKLSESNSDSTEDLADMMDCGSRRDSLVQDTHSEAPAKAMDAKRIAMEASMGTLLRSQNSAFRCWRNEELQFPQDHKKQKIPGEMPPSEGMGDWYSASGSKQTKMSHLFVPNIQCVVSDAEPERGLGSDHTLNTTDTRNVAASKSPEIKINLQGCNATSLSRTDDSKGQGVLTGALKGESSDKVPHFMVRDIREGKGKLQTPIHQVRDVRKLVKSSYHFVSLDHKSNFATADSHQDCEGPTSVSPIVIKCQSVNTNSAKSDLSQERSSPEGTKSSAIQKLAGKAPPGIIDNPLEEMSLRIESRLASKKEKLPEVTDKQQMSNQVALEKLQAAVKTMEQLYVFDKNEWKRKNEPRPVMDSHVLSMIASEENSEEEALRGEIVRSESYPSLNKTPPAVAAECWLRTAADPDHRLKARLTAPPVSSSFKASAGVTVGVSTKTPQLNDSGPVSCNTKTFAPKLPVYPTKTHGESKEILVMERNSDHEDYLTIPVKAHGNGSEEGSSVFTSRSHPTNLPLHVPPSGTKSQEEKSQRSPNAAMATPSPDVPPATIYHSIPLGMSANQPQVYCFSPAITPAPLLDPFQATQKKMLLDPTSGSYYLVDTPVQPSTRRLFDPETGHFVEVPVPQPPMTPVPMPISPLALGPAAYGHTYMIYPGFMTSPPLISTRTLVQPQMLAESGEKAAPHQPEGMYMETPFYMTTGKAASGTSNVVNVARLQQGLPAGKQPVISITSQQGPRIIAPPSFDGTTMSFVVEHR